MRWLCTISSSTILFSGHVNIFNIANIAKASHESVLRGHGAVVPKQVPKP